MLIWFFHLLTITAHGGLTTSPRVGVVYVLGFLIGKGGLNSVESSPGLSPTAGRNCSSFILCGSSVREDLWVREGKILNPEKLFFDEKGSADIQLNCKDSIIAPGFIDVQINGKAFQLI